MTGAPDLTVREAAERWLDRKRGPSSDSSISTLYYRLKQFWEWCEENDVEQLEDVTPWTIEEFEAERRSKIKLLSLNKQFGTIQNWLEWCASRGLVSEDVVEAVDPPDVPKQQKSSDIKLDDEDALPQLAFYRNDEESRASRRHIVLELLWHIGCRMGGLRALDLRDYNDVEGPDGTRIRYLYFRHRPESSTPLKNKEDGERPVWLSERVADLLDEYLRFNRNRVRDENGRKPLFTTSVGRASRTTIRTDSYFGTAPCLRDPCPHDRPDQACEYWSSDSISKCPSTRSPHQIRTGSITWQLNQGVSMTTVSERANVSVNVIEDHYDKPDPMKALRKRRAPELSRLNLGHEIDELSHINGEEA
jgi:site-specific recombinase XerD